MSRDSLADSLSDRIRRLVLLLLPLAVPGSYRMRRLLGSGPAPLKPLPPSSASKSRVNDRLPLPLPLPSGERTIFTAARGALPKPPLRAADDNREAAARSAEDRAPAAAAEEARRPAGESAAAALLDASAKESITSSMEWTPSSVPAAAERPRNADETACVCGDACMRLDVRRRVPPLPPLSGQCALLLLLLRRRLGECMPLRSCSLYGSS